jgi:hypothetical protein
MKYRNENYIKQSIDEARDAINKYQIDQVAKQLNDYQKGTKLREAENKKLLRLAKQSLTIERKVLKSTLTKKERNRISYLKNKDRISLYVKNKKQIDPLFRLTAIIRTAIRNSITKRGYTKASRTHEILGCSFEDFKNYIEIQFSKGMNWENKNLWHLDHIIPISSAKSENELIKLNHYTNFQPLWAMDDLMKSNKIINNTQLKLI